MSNNKLEEIRNISIMQTNNIAKQYYNKAKVWSIYTASS